MQNLINFLVSVTKIVKYLLRCFVLQTLADETEARFAGLCSLVTLSDPPLPSVLLDLEKKLSIPGCLDSGAFLLLMIKDKLSLVPLKWRQNSVRNESTSEHFKRLARFFSRKGFLLSKTHLIIKNKDNHIELL